MDEEADRKRRGVPVQAISLAALAVVAAFGIVACYRTNRSPLFTLTVTPPITSVMTPVVPALAVTTQAALPAGRPTIALATPWEIEGGAAYQTPTPEVVLVTPQPIVVQGPPADSAFRLSDEVSFFWLWPAGVEDGNRFVVYLTGGNGPVLAGSITEMNLGTGYQLQIQPGEIVDQSGNYGWQVVLEGTESGAIIARSEIRPILIVDG